ncbi:pentatricopeptide repeat-containing protein At5g66520-like [Aristolochia californica]|uniref:pentatricopeptide repeat-containing protein At5g66520-like n=1 Tax=Aristolochia californica TaxID=171875 RepID=UPI0035E04841
MSILLFENLTCALSTLSPGRGYPLSVSQILKKCSTVSQLKQLHAQLTVNSSDSSLPSSLSGSLIRAYASLGGVAYAAILFDRFPSVPSILLWNLMIQSYSKTTIPQQSLRLFQKLLLVGVAADDYTFTFVITACSRCGSFKSGQCLHGLVRKNGFVSNQFVGNALVSFYSFFSGSSDAQKLFDEMPHRDVISWTSLIRGYVNAGDLGAAKALFKEMAEPNDVTWAVIIAGYVSHQRYNDALGCFQDLLQHHPKVKPNEAIFVCVLSACAHLGALDQGRWVHAYIDKIQFRKSSNICTGLIDMYAKCGRIDSAKEIFYKFHHKDILTWTSMISGLSMHGHGQDALQLFSQMVSLGIKPDNVTLLGVLNGCSHSGLMDEGSRVFKNMSQLWGVVPKIEHYGCFVDLLSRGGCLEKAFAIVKTMPMDPDIVIWRSLLSACRIHGNVGLGEQIVNHIAQMDSKSRIGGHTLLSNLYASMGRWDKVAKVRKAMEGSRIDWAPGCSCIEINGVVHEFLSADRYHPLIEEIRKKLIEVLRRVSGEASYVANTRPVLFDLVEEEKEQAVAWHSEKLALAFGLMSTEEGTPIRITKNLRICDDCHTAMKSISQVYKREIIVRDRSRFHTFEDGSCICQDYW